MRLIAWIAGLMLISSAGAAIADLDPKLQNLISAAEDAREKAAFVGGEWRDTGKLLKKAKAAAEKGNHKAAMALAEQARMQGEMAYQQSQAQIHSGPRF